MATAKFVLSERTAYELRQLLDGKAPRLADIGGMARQPGRMPYEAESVPPFTLQWCGSANDGEGCFGCYFPGGSLSVAGTTVGIDEESVGDPYAEDWLQTPLEAAGGDLYLVVTKTTSASDDVSYAASWATEPSTETGAMSIKVASAEVSDGAVEVSQLVWGALALSPETEQHWVTGGDNTTCNGENAKLEDYLMIGDAKISWETA